MTIITEDNWKEEFINSHFVECDAEIGSFQYEGKWYAPKFGCDLIDGQIDFIQSLITSVKQQEREKCEKEFLKRTILHSTQVKIISLMKIKDITGLKLREIGKEVGEEHPQKIKHHISHLIKYGYINVISGKYQLSQSLTEEDGKGILLGQVGETHCSTCKYRLVKEVTPIGEYLYCQYCREVV